MPSGGKRAGAGRKTLSDSDPTVRITITLTTNDLAKLKSINANISAAVRILLARQSD